MRVYRGAKLQTGVKATGRGNGQGGRRRRKKENLAWKRRNGDVMVTKPVGRCDCGAWLYEGKDHQCFS